MDKDYFRRYTYDEKERKKKCNNCIKKSYNVIFSKYYKYRIGKNKARKRGRNVK